MKMVSERRGKTKPRWIRRSSTWMKAILGELKSSDNLGKL
jgi:hypothetical protein